MKTYISLIEVTNMKVTVSRKTPTKEVLRNVYDVLNKHIKNPDRFYTSEQLKELKKDKNTIWL